MAQVNFPTLSLIIKNAKSIIIEFGPLPDNYVIELNDALPKADELIFIFNELGLKHTKFSDDPECWLLEPCLNVFDFGYETDFLLIYLLTFIGKEIYSANDLHILIDYSTRYEEETGRIVIMDKNNSATLGSYKEKEDVFTNISKFLTPEEILSSKELLLKGKNLDEIFPPKIKNENGLSEDLKEKYPHDRNFTRINYNEEAFDALTDGQYGEYSKSSDNLDITRIITGD